MSSQFKSRAAFAFGVPGLMRSVATGVPGQVGWGVLAIVLAAADTAEASLSVVPEIDGGTMATGLGVLTGGVLMLRAYWRSR